MARKEPGPSDFLKKLSRMTDAAQTLRDCGEEILSMSEGVDVGRHVDTVKREAIVAATEGASAFLGRFMEGMAESMLEDDG